MPAHDEWPQFLREFGKLTQAQQDQFIAAMKQMVADMRAGRPFRPGLRVKGVQGHPRVYEMTWAPDGRATFMYGAEHIPGEPHIVWRRIGGHEILSNP
jgi:ABC-type Fe3+-hydroxamate transport system substrate-binding protein